MDQLIFQHAEGERNWLSVAFLLIGIVFITFGVLGDAPAIWFVGPGLFVAGAGWLVFKNEKSGAKLTGTQLLLWSGRWRRDLSLAEIAKIQLKEWVDGPPEIAAELNGGELVSIPFRCIGQTNEFIAALRTLKIEIEKI